MNEGESEKKREEGLEICETGENILPQNTKFFGIKIPENGKMMKMNDNHQKEKPITNREDKTEPVVEVKP